MRFIKAKHLKVGDEVLFPQDEVEELRAKIIEVKVHRRLVVVLFKMITDRKKPLEKSLLNKDDENEIIELESNGKCLLVKRPEKRSKTLAFPKLSHPITDTASAIQLLEDVQRVCNDASISASERLALVRTRLCVCRTKGNHRSSTTDTDSSVQTVVSKNDDNPWRHLDDENI